MSFVRFLLCSIFVGGLLLGFAGSVRAQFIRPLPIRPGPRLPVWPPYPRPHPPWHRWHWHWRPPIYPPYPYPVPVPYAVPTPVYIPVDTSAAQKKDTKSSIVLPKDRAVIEVKLPTRDAELWLDGEKIDETGTVRRFLTPELYPGRVYHSRLVAAWVIDNKRSNRTIKVDIKQGDIIRADFTK